MESNELLMNANKLGIHKEHKDDKITAEEFIKIVKHLSQHDFPGAHFYMGMSHYKKQHYNEAFPFLQKASQKESSLPGDAKNGLRFMLGLSYYHGNGTDQDYAQAFEWFMKSAMMYEGVTSQQSQYNLARMYLAGEGTEKDVLMARQWAGKAMFGPDENTIQSAEFLIQNIAALSFLYSKKDDVF